METLALTCYLNQEDPWKDILIAALSEQGYDSFEDIPGGFIAYGQSGTASPDPDITSLIPEAGGDNFKLEWSLKRIPDQNWNAVWESQFEAVLIGASCCIRAPFHTPMEGVLYDIVIEPKMSFGTGHHETTFMMAEWILDNPPLGKNLLDMGCGTGLLAILAHKAGASDVLAIDNNVHAWENARDNFRINGLSDEAVLLGDASLIGGKQFDLVLANIIKGILLHDMPVYANALSKNGELLLSGFLIEDEPEIRQRAEQSGLSYIGRKQKGDWISLKFQKH